MSAPVGGHPVLERRIAALLRNGTWVATLLIGAGVLYAMAGGSAAAGQATAGIDIVSAGIVVLIALPVVRVAVMFGAFVGDGDYPLAGLAALVIAIIASGLYLGLG